MIDDERVRRYDQSGKPNLTPQREAEPEDNECRDVHISPQAITVPESKVCNYMPMAIHVSIAVEIFFAASILLEDAKCGSSFLLY